MAKRDIVDAFDAAQDVRANIPIGDKERRLMRETFPSNSHKEAEKRTKRVEKVIKGKVVKKKKTFFRKLTDTFLGEDVESVSSYLIQDILVPAAKNTLYEMVTGGSWMFLFRGDPRGPVRRDEKRSYVRYDRASYQDDRRERREPSHQNRTRHNFDDVILSSRADAYDVLDHLVTLVEEYDMASVADFYGMVGMEESYTDRRYGWTNLHNARVVQVREGWLIDLPRPMPLD